MHSFGLLCYIVVVANFSILLLPMEDGGGGHWFVWMEWHPAGWSVCLPVLVNLPFHHRVQKFSSGTGSPGWSRKKGLKTVVVWWWLLLLIQWPNDLVLII